jgi:hypothetical protein
MGFLGRLFGTEDEAPAAPRRVPERPRDLSEDELAVERYRYLLRTAPPETIEQVHAEAFSKLTDDQRALIYEQLSRGAGTGERPLSSEPATLARAATRAEMRQPGTLERSFGQQGFGQQGSDAQAGGRGAPGFGSMLGASLLGTVAGYVVGSALMSAFLPWDAGTSEAGADGGSDAGGADAGGADASADAGGFGGGDFGGGDFGGDFGF